MTDFILNADQIKIINTLNKILETKLPIKCRRVYDSFIIQDKDEIEAIIEFRISEFPGCCGIAVLNYIEENLDLKYNKDEDKALNLIHKLAESIAKSLGYTLLLYANRIDYDINFGRKTNKWTGFSKFTNKRTGNRLYLAGKIIR